MRSEIKIISKLAIASLMLGIDLASAKTININGYNHLIPKFVHDEKYRVRTDIMNQDQPVKDIAERYTKGETKVSKLSTNGLIWGYVVTHGFNRQVVYLDEDGDKIFETRYKYDEHFATPAWVLKDAAKGVQ